MVSTWELVHPQGDLGKIDGPSKRNDTNLNQRNPSISNQTNPKKTPSDLTQSVVPSTTVKQPNKPPYFIPSNKASGEVPLKNRHF